ncbi:M56 family metallopeptidase [Aquimarina sp. RZ0]|uniref:M56 family metallopeptidase n=1 Tax=Aquimarina sp. RZ0 TaxID=2607730 RepID=UPI0011F1D7AA|nr:M56 family metallopeptidase [Aquimarina sp. RZ0]KAA1244050.1 hypothetical protein F0000_18170 [Aquimarina sp. RZ0]
MIHYLLQTLIFQLLFLIIYDLLHKKDTFFTLNRFYLIITPLLSLLLPYIKIETLKTRTSEVYITQIENIISLTATPESITTLRIIENTGASINWWSVCYYTGIGISLLLLILRLHKLHVLSNISIKTLTGKNKVIILSNSAQAFSFWNTIFLGDLLNEKEKAQIVSHELVHINQKHSLDHLLFELLKIILWWNPLIYIYQSRMTLLHEYIADEVASNNSDKKTYIQQLLNTAFQTQKITFVNHFFNQSLIKKRILMLQKTKSQSTAKFKYLLLIPLITGILIYTSCEKEVNSTNAKDTINVNKRVSDEDPESICINTYSVHDESLDNYLKITTGSSAEVLISVVSIKTSEIIRRARIKKNKTHRIQNIPEGIYRVDVVYGENYIEQEINGSCTGSFAKEILSETGEDTLDYNVIITDKGKNVPSYNLALDLILQEEKEQLSSDNNSKIKEKIVTGHTSSDDQNKSLAEPLCANQNQAWYDYSLNNYLKINNGKSAEIIITIISKETSQKTRIVHLTKNSSYFIRNIPQGVYNLDIDYGEGYVENMVDGKCIPSFENKLLREEGTDSLNFKTSTINGSFNIQSYAMDIDLSDAQNPTEK